MDEPNLWNSEGDSSLFLGLTDHSDRGEFYNQFEAREKTCGLTNAGAKSLEINAPIGVRMSDHNLRNVINQCNKA